MDQLIVATEYMCNMCCLMMLPSSVLQVVEPHKPSFRRINYIPTSIPDNTKPNIAASDTTN